MGRMSGIDCNLKFCLKHSIMPPVKYQLPHCIANRLSICGYRPVQAERSSEYSV